ncbi:hypothetical protein KBC79_04070, partial [Candidatus Woesebacteria bacterium]|nr:hypothetical protein [Candidatus Woesebacteria bacterium]
MPYSDFGTGAQTVVCLPIVVLAQISGYTLPQSGALLCNLYLVKAEYGLTRELVVCDDGFL